MEVESAKAPTAKSAFSVVTGPLVRLGLVAALLALPVLALPAGAAATPLFESEECFTPTKPTAPFTLAEGPDGNVWFTNEGSTKIGRVTQSCEVTEFSPGLSSAAYGIAKGPDGNVWFTEPSAKKVGYIDPSAPETSLVEFSVPSMPALSYITPGHDGNIWFTLGAAGVGRITPSGVVSEFPIAGVNACSITTGPDGTIWFGSCATQRKVVHITSEGIAEPFEVAGSIASQPSSIAVSSDGRAWFPASNAATERIAAVSPSGVVTYYTTPANASYTSLTTGPDGNVWAQNRASANEKQKVTVEATENLGGTFRLSWEGNETASIPVSAPSPVIESELAAFPGLGPNVKVSRTQSPNKVELVLEFIGKLARTNVPLIGCNGVGLTGVGAGCTVETIAEAAPMKLVRISPVGDLTEFPLKPSTVLAAAKANALTTGAGGALWYANAGDAAMGASPTVGRFQAAPPPGKPLEVIVKGPGRVVGPGIDCPPFCSADIAEGAEVTLTAIPNPGAFFVSWRGCESVNGRQCTVTMGAPRTITATFIGAPGLTVSKAPGSGLGKVTSYPGGILCLANCSTTTAGFKEGAKVKLNQAPAKHFHFVEWLGDCTGSGPCEVTMGEEHEVEALFGEDPKYGLSLAKEGGGQGTVKSLPSGVNCGVTCSSMDTSFYAGEVVELTATPGKGSNFEGWSGGGCSGAGTCVVTMGGAASVKAKFGPTYVPPIEIQ